MKKIPKTTRNLDTVKIALAFVIITIIILAIIFISGVFAPKYTFKDRSMECVITEQSYNNRDNVLNFSDPVRYGYCFGEIIFNSNYKKGNLTLDIIIIDKSSANLKIEFLGSSGIVYEREHIEDLFEEEVWNEFKIQYDCLNETLLFFINGNYLDEAVFNISASYLNGFNLITCDDGRINFFMQIKSVN